VASTLTAFAAVRARIAAAVLAPSPQRRLGRFVLRAGQRQSLREIRDALQRFGGALVADAAGSGKTVLALATAADYDDVLVIVPAALREQWSRAAAKAGVALRLATQESLSRGRTPPSAALIIVDEAHHFRNPASARYRALAALVRDRHLLLLTATPVVNRSAERDALLALFLGRDITQPRTVERVVIRRTDAATRYDVHELTPLPTRADLPAIAAALRALPAPFPTADGAAALALVRISLAFAWASSLAALDAALRRRVQRGEVLADALRDGRWPTRDALRDWIIGRDGTQLAFAFPDTGTGFAVDGAVDDEVDGLVHGAVHRALNGSAPDDALDILETHLCAVRALRAIVAPAVGADIAVRAAALRELVARESPRRIVVLAHHAESVRALYAALRDLPGTVAIVGARVRAAAGRWTRDEVLQRLGPSASPYRADDLLDVRLLLATDILAEGVELQGCATLVHGDAAWTPARLEQRVGRVARDGQRLPVHVTAFALPQEAERLLALRWRLRRKRDARRAALRASDAASMLRAELERWLPDLDQRAATGDGDARCAAAWATQAGFIALLEGAADGAAPQVVAGLLRGGRWRVGTGAPLLAACVRASIRAAPVSAPALRQVRLLLRRWRRRETGRRALHDAAALDPAVMRQVTRRLDAWLAGQPLAQRPAAVERLDAAQRRLRELRGVGAARELVAALRAGPSQEAEAERCFQAIARLAAPSRSRSDATSGRLSALLLLRPRSPDDRDPPSASPGSAATR
jgi:superfamily II DNA or RNA helicase